MDTLLTACWCCVLLEEPAGMEEHPDGVALQHAAPASGKQRVLFRFPIPDSRFPTPGPVEADASSPARPVLAKRQAGNTGRCPRAAAGCRSTRCPAAPTARER